MKNRKLILTSIVFIVSVSGISLNAQSNNEEVDLIQSIFGMEKKAVVADFLGLENENAFWALYDEYETTRKELGKERLVLLYDYAENYDRLNDEKYDQLIANTISLRKRTDKLMDQYYKKIKKVSGSKIAAQFFQLEGYFLIQIRAAIFDEIPYVGEFDE
jgi:hypothetical protein